MNALLKSGFSVLIFGLFLNLISCTKANYDDGYTKGDPPPIAGGYVNSREVASSDLVGYWAFNGDYTDSVGGLTGTNKLTSFVTGQKGQAMNVGDTNYYLIDNPGTVIPALNAFTVSFWMNAPQNTAYGYGIFSLNNPTDFWGSLDIYLDNGSDADSAQFKVHFTNAAATNTGQFMGVKIGNAWNHWVQMVVTYDNSSTVTTSNFVIYQNGAPVFSTLIKDADGSNFGSITFPSPTKIVFGTWQFQPIPSLTNSATAQSWAGSFGGAIDEFRIYKRPLSALEVSALFKLEKQGR
jgi:hypothetical protein